MPKVDDKGRVLIPADVRERLGLVCGAEVDVSVDGDAALLVLIEDRCAICGGKTRLKQVTSDPPRFVCRRCTALVAKA